MLVEEVELKKRTPSKIETYWKIGPGPCLVYAEATHSLVRDAGWTLQSLPNQDNQCTYAPAKGDAAHWIQLGINSVGECSATYNKPQG